MRLVVYTAIEAFALFAVTVLIRLALTADERSLSAYPVIATLAGAAVIAAGSSWLRAITAEDFGLRWSNDLRVKLADHAVVASNRRQRRLGTLTVRMTGDVNAARDWVSIGLPSLVVGGFNAIAAIAALYTVAGGAAAIFGVVSLSVLCVLIALLAAPLYRNTRALRRARGRVSSQVGDIAVAAPSLAWFDARRWSARRTRGRGEEVRQASVRRKRITEFLRSPVALIAPLGVAIAALGIASPVGIGGWTAMLFALGLLTTSALALVAAADGYLSYVAARQRLAILAEEAKATRADWHEGETPFARGEGAEIEVSVDGDTSARTASPGVSVGVVHGDNRAAFGVVDAMARGGVSVRIDGSALIDLKPRDRARRIGWVSPNAPLIRASVRANLRLRVSHANDERLLAAALAAGLDLSAEDLEHRLDPAADPLDPDLDARLRLARAIAHKPRVIFIADPALAADPQFAETIHAVADATGATIIAAAPKLAEGGAEPVWDEVWVVDRAVRVFELDGDDDGQDED